MRGEGVKERMGERVESGMIEEVERREKAITSESKEEEESETKKLWRDGERD